MPPMIDTNEVPANASFGLNFTLSVPIIGLGTMRRPLRFILMLVRSYAVFLRRVLLFLVGVFMGLFVMRMEGLSMNGMR